MYFLLLPSRSTSDSKTQNEEAMMKSAAGAVGKGMKVGSSPGRAEKLPAPGLARLLGGGGRSRGRGGVARSSPMFATRSRSRGWQAEAEARGGAGEEGEPSSPKVTCIGQVRIRNKNKNEKKRGATTTSKSKERRPTATAKDRCRCFKTALFCGMFSGRKKGSGCRPPRSLWWRQWWLGLRSGKSGRYQQRRSTEKVADLMKPPIETVGGGVFESDGEEYRDDDDEEEEEEELENEEEEETRVFVSSATPSLPKNALLLMRCQSTPHNQSSSLATNRFPVSPPSPSESEFYSAEKKIEGREDEEKKEEKDEEEGRKSSNGSSGDDGEEGEKEGSWPLVLTRCKSVPTRLVVVPEASYCFWANRSDNGRLALVHEERPPPSLKPK